MNGYKEIRGTLIKKRRNVFGKYVFIMEESGVKQKIHVGKGKNYLVVDDLIATGGTLVASRNLIEQGGGTAVSVFLRVGGILRVLHRKPVCGSAGLRPDELSVPAGGLAD